jgi:hypothetical protein
MIYAWRYPESIHRSAMIRVNPHGGFLWDRKTTDELIGRYAALWATTTGAILATYAPAGALTSLAVQK